VRTMAGSRFKEVNQSLEIRAVLSSGEDDLDLLRLARNGNPHFAAGLEMYPGLNAAGFWSVISNWTGDEFSAASMAGASLAYNGLCRRNPEARQITSRTCCRWPRLKRARSRGFSRNLKPYSMEPISLSEAVLSADSLL